MALSNKQQAFINEYLIDFNATRAAERAGYKGNEDTLASVGWENLRKPEIAETIQKRLQEKAMTADEVLMRLAGQARADIGPWLDYDGNIDLQRMIEDGATHLLRKVKRTRRSGTTKDGGDWEEVIVEVELHDAQAALVQLGKHHRLFAERTELTGKDGSPISVDHNNVNVNVFIPDNGRNDRDPATAGAAN